MMANQLLVRPFQPLLQLEEKNEFDTLADFVLQCVSGRLFIRSADLNLVYI